VTASTIALDGPAASGKSSIGAALARELGYRFLDTGAMYRAVTWIALQRGVDVHDETALTALAQRATIVAPSDTSHDWVSVMVDGEDVTPHLRDPSVEANVSLVSRVPGVRAALVQIQRDIAREGMLVMAGRDIGTVVMPDADLKVFLDASNEVRARRRARQEGIEHESDITSIREEIAQRDGIDSTREASPLTPASGAVIINTDDMTVEEVVLRIAALARE
jgi:cytidylate kinase